MFEIPGTSSTLPLPPTSAMNRPKRLTCRPAVQEGNKWHSRATRGDLIAVGSSLSRDSSRHLSCCSVEKTPYQVTSFPAGVCMPTQCLCNAGYTSVRLFRARQAPSELYSEALVLQNATDPTCSQIALISRETNRRANNVTNICRFSFSFELVHVTGDVGAHGLPAHTDARSAQARESNLSYSTAMHTPPLGRPQQSGSLPRRTSRPSLLRTRTALQAASMLRRRPSRPEFSRRTTFKGRVRWSWRQAGDINLRSVTTSSVLERGVQYRCRSVRAQILGGHGVLASRQQRSEGENIGYCFPSGRG